MTKLYAVMKEKVVVFGPVPEAEYNKVVEFLGKLGEADKLKYRVVMKVVATSVSEPVAQAPGQTVKVQSTLEPKPVLTTTKKKEIPVVSTPDEFVFADSSAAFSAHLEGSGGAGEYWKAKDGRNLIRVLPLGGVSPIDWKTPYPFVSLGLHSSVGLSMQETVHCPRITHNRPCPICSYVWKLYNSKAPDDIAIAKKIKAYKRVIANIVVLSDVESGVQKFAFGKKLAEKLSSYLQDQETKLVLHPENGNNFILIKKVLDGYPNYDESRFEMKSTSITQILPNWRDQIHNLTLDLKEKTYDELVVVLRETKKAIMNAGEDFEGSPISDVHKVNVDVLPTTQEGFQDITEVGLDDLDNKLSNF